jgi:hypothetical protein
MEDLLLMGDELIPSDAFQAYLLKSSLVFKALNIFNVASEEPIAQAYVPWV